MTKSQMQNLGLSRSQIVRLRRQVGDVTPDTVAREISRNGKWAHKVVPAGQRCAPPRH